MLLELCDISKRYDDCGIIDDINIALDKGQSVAVIAPSGTGKSTLLSIAGLLLTPSSGTVEIEGQDTSVLDDKALSRLRCEKIGFLFQHTHLIGSLRALENVSIAADFLPHKARMSNAEITSRAQDALCALGLENRMYHYPSQLSNGQKRRIATARALFLEPSIIIADEPTNDLDDENAAKVIDALFARVRGGCSCLLMATHDRELASCADRIIDLSCHTCEDDL